MHNSIVIGGSKKQSAENNGIIKSNNNTIIITRFVVKSDNFFETLDSLGGTKDYFIY